MGFWLGFSVIAYVYPCSVKPATLRSYEGKNLIPDLSLPTFILMVTWQLDILNILAKIYYSENAQER